MVSVGVFIVYMVTTTICIAIIGIILAKTIKRQIQIFDLLTLVKNKNTERYKYLYESVKNLENDTRR